MTEGADVALGRDEISNRFGFHPATDETKALHVITRAHFAAVAAELDDMLPDSREKSLALTALQEAAMWSNAAIACHLAPLVFEKACRCAHPIHGARPCGDETGDPCARCRAESH